MQIIPVIDLKDGHVVKARYGSRSDYQALKTPLFPSSSIFDVMETFLNLHPFEIFYIADLNAITHQGSHQQLINAIVGQYHDIEFWIDDGSQLTAINDEGPKNLKTVIGTESQQSIVHKPSNDYILSLDFKAEQRWGHPQFFESSDLWPQQIIIMTLAKVGSHSGPDFVKLARYCHDFPEKQFIAAGGVRNVQDLQQLKNIGINKALIASALHSGCIDSLEIKKLQTKKYPE